MEDFPKGMAMNAIGNFFLSYVLASNNAAWSYVPGISSMPTAGVIMNSAFFTWLGFFLPVDLNTVAWERKSWKLSGSTLVTISFPYCLQQ
jgi:hypothetical protein